MHQEKQTKHENDAAVPEGKSLTQHFVFFLLLIENSKQLTPCCFFFLKNFRLKGAKPAYLLDRTGNNRAKILSNSLKQKRKEKAGKWDVPLPKVRGIAEDELFKVVRTGKRKSKQLLKN
jgi:hypothetical protein